MAGSGTAHLRPHRDDRALVVERLVVEHRAGLGRTVEAVSDVSFDLLAGETLGLVGESGGGKSSTAKAVIQLPPPTSGTVTLFGVELTALRGEALRRARPDVQMIFQDPIGSLNPRRRVFDIVAEAARVRDWRREERDQRVAEVLLSVGLDPEPARRRRPHEYSGGQCQRIAVARAMVLEPRVLICDEPVSALDVSVQAQVLNLLEDMKDRHGLTMLFISHDLSVVKHVSDRVAVMYLGKLCEIGDGDALYRRPAHPYTRLLLAAVPDPDGARTTTAPAAINDPPSALDPPTGCRFRTRCPRAQSRCTVEEPQMAPVGDGDDDHWVACHFPHDESAPGGTGPEPGGAIG